MEGPLAGQLSESVLFTLAEVGVTFAGFSGLVVAFRSRGAHTWSRTELRTLWFLIGDSLLVLLLALLPLPLGLWEWSPDFIWGACSAPLGQLVLHRQLSRDTAVAFGMGLALWLSVFSLLVPRGQAVYVLGLIVLMVFAAVEFLFFIGLMAEQEERT